MNDPLLPRRKSLGAICPVCADPQPYCLWVDPVDPTECPLGAATITDCEYQMAKAHEAALFRRVRPDCFDENGNIKPNTIGYVITAAMEAEPGHKLMIGGIPESMLRRAGKL